jgi:molecular chaperone IbpA
VPKGQLKITRAERAKGIVMFNIYPITRDFDEIFENFTSSVYKVDNNYPPYNIFTIEDEERYGKIEIACAGIPEENIKVYFDDSDLLVVEGTYPEAKERQYTHKGLSTKDFAKKFRLEKNWEIKEVNYENGLLEILLIQNKPKKQFIPINKSNILEDKSHKNEKESEVDTEIKRVA